MEKRLTKTERERLYKRQLSCVSGSEWGQVDENDLDHIICKVGVITRFAALNRRAHSGKHTESQAASTVPFLLASSETNCMQKT